MGIEFDCTIFLAIVCTFSLVWVACLGESYVGIAVHVRSNKALRGHGEDTMPATAKWSAAAGLPTPARHYKLMTSVGLLPLLSLLESVVSGLLKNPGTER